MEEKINNLKINEVAIFEYHEPGYTVIFQVKKVKKNLYVLHSRANQNHSRWGTKEEILKDLQFAMNSGYLPTSKSKNWA